MNLILLFEEDFDDSGKTVSLSGRRWEHITKVHRASPGDELTVGLLNGKVGTGRISSIDGSSLTMSVELNSEAPPPLPLTLLLAMPRPKMLKRILQSVTAMGVKRIYLINAWRVEKSFWESPVLKEEMLREQMILGLEQAKDTILPEVHIRKFFKPFVEDELPEIAKDTLPLVAHPIASEPCPRGLADAVTLAVGPEGGFIPYEVERLEGAGFMAVHMGERILRVETAIPALLARLY
jgi:RsmE family RNA methyltransferase